MMIMNTRILKANEIDEVVSLLRAGEVVALPTETVYGLAADATNIEAMQKIFIAKNRPADHPLIVHIDALDKVNDWAERISENAKKLAEFFWPGPLTMIFSKKNTVNELITGGLNTIALRIPHHRLTLEVIKKLGGGIAAPSANAHKKTSPTKPEHVLKTLKGKIAAILDGGRCSVGIESTIVDMTHETPVILRPGAITASMIENLLGVTVEQPSEHQEKVSGNMKVHYQPDKQLFIMSIEEIKHIQKLGNVAIIYHSHIVKIKNVSYYKMPTDKTEYAKMLYETLHRIDKTNVEKIIVERPPISGDWTDINDRLLRASSK